MDFIEHARCGMDQKLNQIVKTLDKYEVSREVECIKLTANIFLPLGSTKGNLPKQGTYLGNGQVLRQGFRGY